MMQLILSIIILVFFLLVLRFGLHFMEKWRRAQGTRADTGERTVRLSDGLSAMITSNKTMPGGPTAGSTLRTLSRIVLTEKRLLVATNQGRIMEMSQERPGEARAIGPRRLALLGLHPTGRADIRIELVIQDEEMWSKEINSRFKPKD
jgi:hypothetical protein